LLSHSRDGKNVEWVKRESGGGWSKKAI